MKILTITALLTLISTQSFAQGATMSPPSPFSAESMPQSANSVPLNARTIPHSTTFNERGGILNPTNSDNSAKKDNNHTTSIQNKPAAQTVPQPK